MGSARLCGKHKQERDSRQLEKGSRRGVKLTNEKGDNIRLNKIFKIKMKDITGQYTAIQLIILFRKLTGLRKRHSWPGRGGGPG